MLSLLQLLAFVKAHTDAGEAKLAGNSVHVDAQFLRRRMPRLFRHFSHRIVDVSTLGELCQRWFPREWKRAPRKKVVLLEPSERPRQRETLYARLSLVSPWPCRCLVSDNCANANVLMDMVMYAEVCMHWYSNKYKDKPRRKVVYSA